jgi:hypothetical protein
VGKEVLGRQSWTSLQATTKLSALAALVDKKRNRQAAKTPQRKGSELACPPNEPFTPAAIGWGNHPDRLNLAVAGEPRNRDLAFATLLRFATWLNSLFEAHASNRETFTRGNATWDRARTAPQVVVANGATVEMLGRLGRRLAYLPTDCLVPIVVP